MDYLGESARLFDHFPIAMLIVARPLGRYAPGAADEAHQRWNGHDRRARLTPDGRVSLITTAALLLQAGGSAPGHEHGVEEIVHGPRDAGIRAKFLPQSHEHQCLDDRVPRDPFHVALRDNDSTCPPTRTPHSSPQPGPRGQQPGQGLGKPGKSITAPSPSSVDSWWPRPVGRRLVAVADDREGEPVPARECFVAGRRVGGHRKSDWMRPIEAGKTGPSDFDIGGCGFAFIGP